MGWEVPELNCELRQCSLSVGGYPLCWSLVIPSLHQLWGPVVFKCHWLTCTLFATVAKEKPKAIAIMKIVLHLSRPNIHSAFSVKSCSYPMAAIVTLPLYLIQHIHLIWLTSFQSESRGSSTNNPVSNFWVFQYNIG